MSVESALQALRLDPRFMRNVAVWQRIPARSPQYAPFLPQLDIRFREVLAGRGVTALYTHQAEAVAAALAGGHVAVVTPAASGKTLCYNLPVLQRLLADPHGRALYLFPTKALAQDQLAELRDLVSGLPAPDLPIATYDGDTPSSQRPKIREMARVVLSNPDMLHAGILPQHTRWAGFFAGLRFVVIDEMHVYRGVFGSHVANVFRRLRRICRFYGSQPQFILASATIANPQMLATRLVEAPVTLIGEARNGAPQAEKEILFYNPPLLDPALGIRRSSSLEAADLAAHFLAHGVQTIIFARARLTTELVLTDLRLRIADGGLPLEGSQAVRGYRGGYLPTERRAIEAGLREGAVRGVVATNALELGIDIGRLDAAVLAGYPGAIASARQQIGRAGRRSGTSAAVLVASATPLDQYIVAHPEFLLERSPEHALLNPDNELILAGHLACSAAELPFETGETLGTDQAQMAQDLTTGARGVEAELLDDLVAAGQLYRAGSRCFWAGEGSPASTIGLRTGFSDRVVIHFADAAGKPQIIGEVDRPSVPLLLYEGAIYLHEGASYLVERLDWEGGIAHVRPVEVDFYTRPSIGETVEVLAVHASSPVNGGARQTRLPARDGMPSADVRSGSDVTPLGPGSQPPSQSAPPPARASWGDVRVVSQAAGYKIIRRGTNEVLGFGEIDLPEQVLETQACWLEFPHEMVDALKAEGMWFSDANDYGPEWAGQRDAARARDGYRCQGCGALEMPPRQHDVHHRVPFRAFTADPVLRQGLPPELAWRIANRSENLVTLCAACHRRAEASVRIRSGLGGMAALLAGVAPLGLMCDLRDLGVVTEPQHPTTGLPRITLYEKTPGGVGYAEQLYASITELLQAALDLVAGCRCELGCPSCVGPVLEHEYALDAKMLAAALLRACGAQDAAAPGMAARGLPSLVAML